MTISLLRLINFRNIAALEIKPQERGLNIIYGQNGSGKSSLLEALHYLGHGKSFRTAITGRLVRHSTDQFVLFAQIKNTNDHTIPLGIERSINGQTRLRLAGNDIDNFAEFASLLPTRIINSQSHQLFESGPQFRRKFIDWGLFHSNLSFFTCWRHFERALKQRNTLLAARKSSKEIDVWTKTLAQHASLLHDFRKNYVQDLAPFFQETAKQLLPLENFSLNYQAGWDESKSYAEILAKSQVDDMHFGYTQYGPQRADLMIKTNGILVKHFLSRGQQKLLICAMILAQGLLLAKTANKRLIYLVDDLPSELDCESRKRLLSMLIKQDTQIFITAIEPDSICDLVDASHILKNVFHVEQGSVNEFNVGD